jgi:hypothetical protein
VWAYAWLDLAAAQISGCTTLCDRIGQVLAAVQVFFRSRLGASIEILALRQELAVFKRKHPRLKLSSVDRLFWSILLSRTLWCAGTELDFGSRGRADPSTVSEISKELLAHSQYIREPHFRAIRPRDLELYFAFYDKRFFAGFLHHTLV